MTFCSYYDNFCFYMNLDGIKLEKLQCAFPKLTEANQYYVLGLAEGLIHAQNVKVADKPKETNREFGKNEGLWRDK